MATEWKDKDGKEWLIRNMDDLHLINCIRYLNKQIESDDDFITPPVYYDLMNEYNERIEDSKNGQQ